MDVTECGEVEISRVIYRSGYQEPRLSYHKVLFLRRFVLMSFVDWDHTWQDKLWGVDDSLAFEMLDSFTSSTYAGA